MHGNNIDKSALKIILKCSFKGRNYIQKEKQKVSALQASVISAASVTIIHFPKEAAFFLKCYYALVNPTFFGYLRFVA